MSTLCCIVRIRLFAPLVFCLSGKSAVALVSESIASVVPPPPSTNVSCLDVCDSGSITLVPQGYEVSICASVSVPSGSGAATASVKAAVAESVDGIDQLQQVTWELECEGEILLKVESSGPTLAVTDGEVRWWRLKD